jgi:HD-GYP domain-containing protein (c-di-GMP phosphodiesterase class II)
MTQFARMVGVIDKYEALTSDRPHRPAMHPYKATQAVRDELVGQFEQELFVPMLRMVSPKPA